MNRKNILILIIALLVLGGVWYLFTPASLNNIDDVDLVPVQEEVGVETVSLDPERIDREVFVGEAILVDVRTDVELEETGYAASSIHFDLARLQSGELPEFPQDIKVYVYCRSGGRAGEAEGILRSSGFTDVVNIGGLADWEEAGGVVIK